MMMRGKISTGKKSRVVGVVFFLVFLVTQGGWCAEIPGYGPRWYHPPSPGEVVHQYIQWLREATGETTGCLVYRIDHENVGWPAVTAESKEVQTMAARLSKWPALDLENNYGTTDPLEAAMSFYQGIRQGHEYQRIWWWPDGFCWERTTPTVFEHFANEQPRTVVFAKAQEVVAFDLTVGLVPWSKCEVISMRVWPKHVWDPRFFGKLSRFAQTYVEEVLPREVAQHDPATRYEVTTTTLNKREVWQVTKHWVYEGQEYVTPILKVEWELTSKGRRLVSQTFSSPDTDTEVCQLSYADDSLFPSRCVFEDWIRWPELEKQAGRGPRKREVYTRLSCSAFPGKYPSIEQYVRRASYDVKKFLELLKSVGVRFEAGTWPGFSASPEEAKAKLALFGVAWDELTTGAQQKQNRLYPGILLSSPDSL